MKKYFFLIAAAFAVMAVSSCNGKDDPENKGGKVDIDNPTSSVASLYVINAPVKDDPEGFNMLTDGSFDRFQNDPDWKAKSLWYMNELVEESAEPYDGRSLHLFYDGEGWYDLAVQTVCIKKNQSYDLTLKYRGAWRGLNAYMGFRAAEVHDVNTNNADRNDAWDEGYSLTFNNIDDTEASAFLGGWWWYGLWVDLDDMKVIPSGSSNDSFIPDNATVAATSIASAAKEAVASAEKIVVDATATVGILHNVTVDGTAVENAFIKCGINQAGNFVVAEVIPTDIKDFIPTAIVKVGETTYVHGYTYGGLSEITEENPEQDWTASKVAVLSSQDGAAWTEAVSFAADGKFAKAAYCQKGDYVYMFGSAAGDSNVRTYVARVKPADLASAGAYEYWDGEGYVKGDETLATGVFYGPTDFMSVAYNPEKYAFMAVYRSRTTGQLVYRDAGLAEGEWSGEKLLVADPSNTELYAPQIYSVSKSALGILASKK